MLYPLTMQLTDIQMYVELVAETTPHARYEDCIRCRGYPVR
jgi:hypothetical protein